MATTLSELETYFYQAVAENTSSGEDDVFPPTFVDELLNQGQYDVCMCDRVPLKFLEADKHYTTIADTTVNNTSGVTAGDTTLTLTDSSSFPTSGTAFLGTEIITWTGNSSNILTGIPASGTGAITVDHDNGEIVRPGYTLPTNFGWVRQLIVDGSDYDYIDYVEYNRESFTQKYGFTIYQDTLFLPSSSANKIAQFRFYKIPATMTASVNATIPDVWAKRVIVPYAVAQGLLHRDRADEAAVFMDQFKKHYGRMVLDQSSSGKQKRFFSRIRTRYDDPYSQRTRYA